MSPRHCHTTPPSLREQTSTVRLYIFRIKPKANDPTVAYENGASALLLQLSGTLPVNFRGTTYRFPIALWVQHGYPQEAPLVYVTPTEGMAVRPGQHVDPQGRIYHPYLVGWAEFWDVSSQAVICCSSVGQSNSGCGNRSPTFSIF